MMNNVPTLQEFAQIAPVVTITSVLIAGGFIAGFKSRDQHIESLKAWIESIKK